MQGREYELDSNAQVAIKKILQRGDDARVTTGKTGIVIYSEHKRKEYVQPQVGGCEGRMGPESSG